MSFLPVFLSTKDANNKSHNESKYIYIYIYILYFLQLQQIVMKIINKFSKIYLFFGRGGEAYAVYLFAVPTFLDQFKIKF